MHRRAFLASAAALSAVGFAAPVSAHSSAAVHTGRRTFTVQQKFALKAPQGSEGIVKLWLPLPEDHVFQRLVSLSFDGNYRDAFTTDANDYGARTLFATWDDAKHAPHLAVQMTVETLDWEPLVNGFLNNYRVPDEICYPKDVLPYLAATPHMLVDGIVQTTAQKIVGQENNPLKQARLIYNWVSANMRRDNTIPGCGNGDVKAILESGKLVGKCTDINSVFVALARAVGIPAREMFGIRLGRAIKMGRYSGKAFGSADASGLAQISGAQHCRAMFYLAGFGWLPVDPADVTKMRLQEKKSHYDPDVQAVNDYLFGNWEMNWLGFNVGRDFLLQPQPAQGEINNFGYPYAEVDGDPLDNYDAKAFAYEFSAQEI